MNQLQTARNTFFIFLKPIFRRVALRFSLALIFLNVSPAFVCGEIVNSAVIARIGSDLSAVIDSQSNTFFDLSASVSGVTLGVIETSDVDASFVSEDLFQVNVTNTWDYRNHSPGGITTGFGRNFEYEFTAEGNAISVTATNFVGQPLFSGASTVGLSSFRWRIFDLTASIGFTAIDFDSDGTQSLPIVDGHKYLLRLSDNSAVAGAGINLGIFHSATFDVSVPAAPPVLLGDVDMNGTVDFLDISPFIAVLSGGTFQAEADCDESGAVDFLDISPFIAILSGS